MAQPIVNRPYYTSSVRAGLGDAGPQPQWGAARAATAGVAYQHAEYPAGTPGVRRSLSEMARLMREARLDKDVAGYAADVLKAAGIDGRDRARWTARNVTQALLDNVRSVVIYTPDALGAEVITSPAGQLCLRPGLCIRKEDCDGLSTLLGALVMCVGFRVWILKQSWGADQQEHVLIAVEDEGGQKLKADPSHASLPVGQGVPAVREEYYDPMDENASIKVGAGAAELVTFGALPRGRAAPVRRVVHQINSQLTPGPARRAGLGFIGQDVVQVSAAETDGLMDATDAAVRACANMSTSDVTAWGGVYTGWKTWLAQLNSCLDSSFSSILTACSPYEAGPGDWSRAQQGLLGYQTQARSWQAKIKLACPTYQPTPPLPTPQPLPPNPNGPTSLSDDIATGAKAIGGLLVAGVVVYGVYKVVQVTGDLADKHARAAVPAAQRAAAVTRREGH